ncbi:MAG: hypothetical protein WCD35_17195 [Mycobacteriales bacterium]
MNDLDHLRRLDPAAGPVPQGGRTELLAALSTTDTPPRRGRKRLVAVLTGGFVATAAGGSIAYAVLSGQPEQTALGIQCAVTTTQSEFDRYHELSASMTNITGDPVADCAAEYARLNGRAPSLLGYSSGTSSIFVIPSTWTAPSDWRPLPTTFRVDAKRLELAQRLDDLVAGPPSTCMSHDTAEERIISYESELGLTGWATKRLPTSDADGSTSCAYALVDDNGSNTVLIGAHQYEKGQATPGTPDLAHLIAELRTQISQRCLSLEDAQHAVRQALGHAGVNLKDAKLPAALDPSARCTRVVLVPAGLTVIVLRGPQTAAP